MNEPLQASQSGEYARAFHDPVVYYDEDDEGPDLDLSPTDTNDFSPRGVVGMFQRDVRSVGEYHKFTPNELKKMENFEGINYREPQTALFKDYIARNLPLRKKTERMKWFVYALIGFACGILAFLVEQLIHRISKSRMEVVGQVLHASGVFPAYITHVGLVVGLTLVATIPVVFIQREAGGSGVPEVMGYLNGVLLPKVFNIRTLLVKFVSCVTIVSSGLPVGPEGPMIHMGAALGAGLSQGRSGTFRFSTDFFKYFRNHHDHREFICGGAAAGVAAAFGAPLGGLLFIFEEIASHWDKKLTWKVFFGCMVAGVVVDLFNTAFTEFEVTGKFPYLSMQELSMFSQKVDTLPKLNAVVIFPAAFIGIVCGLLGSLFTLINVRVSRLRAKYVNPTRKWRMVDAMFSVILYSTATFLIAMTFGCQELSPKEISSGEKTPEFFTGFCPNKTTQYNSFASLALNQGSDVVKRLTRVGLQSEEEYSYTALFSFASVYFLGSALIAGGSFGSGIVVPMLVIGGSIGRIMGMSFNDLIQSWGLHIVEGTGSWSDPGMFALIGSASFFAGVTRLTIALVVIMIEITNSLQHLLPFCVGVMCAKSVADYFTHSLYHALLEVKCVPYIDAEVEISQMECFTAEDIMGKNVVTLKQFETIENVQAVLQSSKHNGFPVVDQSNRLRGLVLREHLVSLAFAGHAVTKYEDLKALENQLKYSRANRKTDSVIMQNSLDSSLSGILDLTTYTDPSPCVVYTTFGLKLVYDLFRSMSLRHVVVVEPGGGVVGIITRKDLLGHHIASRILQKPLPFTDSGVLQGSPMRHL